MKRLTQCGYCDANVINDDDMEHTTDEHFYKGNCRKRHGSPPWKDKNGCV